MKTFNNYNDWHAAITGPCGLNLTLEFCTDRITALQDDSIPSTKSFIESYGSDYRDQVIEWFKLAQNTAVE